MAGNGGFEIDGAFYEWSVTDKVSDLRLIDLVTSGMPVPEFFQAVDDEHERQRGPIVSAMIATSIRAARPDWSVERIFRMVDGVSLGEVVFVEGESEAEEVPPPEGVEKPTVEPESTPIPSEGLNGSADSTSVLGSEIPA